MQIKSRGESIFNIINIAIMLLILAICMAPLLHVFFSSISDPIKLIQHKGIVLWPQGFSIKGYFIVFQNPSLMMGYANTLFYVVVGTLISVALTAIGAYTFSRKNLLWRDQIMFLITFTMFFAGGLIPTYMVVKALGMVDTRWAVIIPSAISVFNLIIMRTAFMEIPESLVEAARIDGAGEMTILIKIILPCTKATFAVMALFYGVAGWNSWFPAMIYISNRNLLPLQVILREILIQNDTTSIMTNVGSSANQDAYKTLVKYCTIVVATLPILCVYPFIQKYFTTGVMIGSVKG